MEIRSLNYLCTDEHAQLKYRLVAYVNASLQLDYGKAAKQWGLQLSKQICGQQLA